MTLRHTKRLIRKSFQMANLKNIPLCVKYTVVLIFGILFDGLGSKCDFFFGKDDLFTVKMVFLRNNDA